MSTMNFDAQEKIHMQLKDLKGVHSTLSTYVERKIIQHLRNYKIKDKKIIEEVEDYLGYYLDDLFNAVKFSCDIDGLPPKKLRKIDINEYLNDPDKLNERVEPYDFALNDKLKNVHSQVEDVVHEIVNLRKTKPQTYYESYKQKFAANEKQIDDAIENNRQLREQELKQLESDDGDKDEDENFIEEDFGSVKDMLTEVNEVLHDLVELKKDIPESKIRLQNLCQTVDFILDS
ncbi:unnamed protein product [Ambrosiozyma monospora]|uniref:Unnamed protein product n=1 Tax=Ambrosiozyma monospora TaxID=43982 RepID=A0A9W6Z4Y8_AMBMO|nr:unnamed protein product [Ambrosiozyma monospora]